MRTRRYFWALAAALLASCYDYGAPDEVVYGEAVFTQPSPGFDFKPLTSYYLDPQYRLVDGDQVTDVNLPSNVATAIENNMQALGYTKVTALPPAGTPATVGLKVAVLKGAAAVYYPGYWCDYWYYYSCYYNWYYAGSYTYGTVVLEMGDLSAPAAGTLPVVWTGLVYGVASAGPVDSQRVVDGINRAFGQSPYLDTH
jgi:hypothetical protein